MLSRASVALLLGFMPVLAAAQAPGPTLPLITIDGVVGGTRHPDRSAATFYRFRSFPVARLALAVRLGSRGTFKPVAVLEYSTVLGEGDHISNCLYAPNGTCKAYFADVSGASAGIGVRRLLGRSVTVGLTGGVGRYKMDDNGSSSETLTGFHADLDFSIRFMKHAGIVGSIRHIETGRYKDARMWYRPITFGLRLQ